MYGVIFAVGIMVISVVLFVNVMNLYRTIARNDINDALSKVSDYVKENGIPDNETIRGIVGDDNIIIELQMLRQDMKIMIRRGNQPDFGTRSERQISRDGNNYMLRGYRSIDGERATIKIFVLSFMVFNVIGIAAAFFVGRYISVKTLKPIRDLIHLASKMSIDDLDKRIEIDENAPDDEIKLLTNTFNDMTERLALSFDMQTRFIQDASHELRTPISVIQGYANILSRWGKDDPEVLTESVESIKSETERMTALVKKLLYLASNEEITAKTEVSLNDCAKEAADELSVIEMPHTIRIFDEAKTNIYGDKDLIRQLLIIFIENSIKYRRNDEANIEIHIGEGFFSVKDDGLGIGAEDIPHIFKRFYRGDKSRSQTISGTGLGLSIAERIIQLHGAKVSLTSAVLSGTEITVKFPDLSKE